MKKISFLIMSLLLTSLSIADDNRDKSGNLYLYKDKNGKLLLTDIPSPNAKVFKNIAPENNIPAPVVDVKDGKDGKDSKEIKQDSHVLNSDTQKSIIKEKEATVSDISRKHNLECLKAEQDLIVLKSSRDFNVDPGTGGDLNARKIRELEEQKLILCKK